MNNYRLEIRKIKPEEYKLLRQTTGWVAAGAAVLILTRIYETQFSVWVQQQL